MAFNWEFDADFVAGLEGACSRRGMTSYRIDPYNLKETMQLLSRGSVAFAAFFDRASDTDEMFLPLVQNLEERSAYCINPHPLVVHASDKATMHLELITHGLQVPYTIIVSPYNKKKEVELNLSELEYLGRPFIIKPANTTGGGTGVVLGAESLKDIIESRQHHKNDKYLLQEKIEPKMIGGRRAWFRVFYAFGNILPCWWDDVTHVYAELSGDEETASGLGGLRRVMEKIYEVCRLHFFSSEIALTKENKFVVVDYVNDVCDMRLQSKYIDGVPDAIVHEIENLIAADVGRNHQLVPTR